MVAIARADGSPTSTLTAPGPTPEIARPPAPGTSLTVTMPAPAPAAAQDPGIDWAVVLLAVIAGLSAVRTVLVFVAPRTKTTLDDRALDGIDAMLALLRSRSPGAGNVSISMSESRDPRDPRGIATPALLFSVAFVGLMAVAAGAGCSSVRARGAAAAGAFIDCQAEHLQATLAELVPLARPAVSLAIRGDGSVDTTQLRAAAAPLRSDLARCAFAGAIAALAAPQVVARVDLVTGRDVEIHVGGVDPARLLAAFADVRAELGWPAMVADGVVSAPTPPTSGR